MSSSSLGWKWSFLWMIQFLHALDATAKCALPVSIITLYYMTSREKKVRMPGRTPIDTSHTCTILTSIITAYLRTSDPDFSRIITIWIPFQIQMRNPIIIRRRHNNLHSIITLFNYLCVSTPTPTLGSRIVNCRNGSNSSDPNRGRNVRSRC